MVIDLKKLTREYKEEGLTFRQLESVYGCSRETLRKRLKDGGIPPRGSGCGRRTKVLDIPTEKLIKEWEEGDSISTLAKRYSCSNSYIYHFLAKTKQSPKDRIKRKSMGVRDRHIFEHFEYIGGTYAEIAKIYKLTSNRIRQIINEQRRKNV